MNLTVALPSEAKEVVVLANDLPAGPRKVQRDVAHVAAEIVHPEHHTLGQVLLFAPQHPTHTERGEAELMPRSVD